MIRQYTRKLVTHLLKPGGALPGATTTAHSATWPTQVVLPTTMASAMASSFTSAARPHMEPLSGRQC